MPELPVAQPEHSLAAVAAARVVSRRAPPGQTRLARGPAQETIAWPTSSPSRTRHRAVFPPPRPSSRAGERQGTADYERAERRGRSATTKASGRDLAREHVALEEAVHEGARRVERAVLQVVRRRHAERLVQLPRPQRRGRHAATRSRSSSRPTTARSRRSPTSELLARVCRLANALKARGVKKGDRVVIYMPMSIEGVVAMQACARIGATHSVVFGGFSAQSLRDRIDDAGAVVVITADEQLRGGKQLPLKADRRRGARAGRLRGDQERHRLPAHRRQRRAGTRRATTGCTS